MNRQKVFSNHVLECFTVICCSPNYEFINKLQTKKSKVLNLLSIYLQSCWGFFVAPDSLYEWTKEKLPCGTDKGLFCPKCRCWRWEIDELILKCNMSRDETIFYKHVASLNERTAKELEKVWRKEKNKSRSLPVLDDEYFA